MSDSIKTIGRYAFYKCEMLANVTMGSGIKSIGTDAFRECGSITQIMIPDGVTSIGGSAFMNCEALTIYCEAAEKPSGWDNNWNYYGGTVVWDCKNNDKDGNGYAYTVIDGLRYSIKDGVATVIRQPNNITTANIPATVTYKNVKYSVTSIEASAFYHCNVLTSVTIPNSVESIKKYGFLNSNAVTIYCEAAEKPSGWDVGWMSNPVVWDCKNNNKDENGYEYAVIDGLRYSLKDGVATIVRQPTNLSGNVEIPDVVTYKNANYSVTSIESFAFSNCIGLTSIKIPINVTNIEDNAFYGCKSLIIYCEAARKPSGWGGEWNRCGINVYEICKVIWDCNNNDRD